MPSFQPPRLRNYRFFGVSYMANIVPRNATGHGRGGEIAAQSVPLAAFFQPLRPSEDRKSTRLNSSHYQQSRMPSSA